MKIQFERTIVVRTPAPAKFFSLPVFFFFVVLSLASCSGNKNSNTPESDVPKPAPLSASPSAPVSAICSNPYYPVSPTLKREYRSTYADVRLNTTYTESFTNIAPDSITFNFNFSNGSSMTNGFKCTADGLASVEFAQITTPNNTVKFQTLSASGVTIPVPDKWVKGFKWTSSYQVEGKLPGGEAKGSINIANEILGEETVVVPAGTFVAYKVESNIAQKMMASLGEGKPLSVPIDGAIKVTNWYAKDVGMVKTFVEGLSTVELLSFSK